MTEPRAIQITRLFSRLKLFCHSAFYPGRNYPLKRVHGWWDVIQTDGNAKYLIYQVRQTEQETLYWLASINTSERIVTIINILDTDESIYKYQLTDGQLYALKQHINDEDMSEQQALQIIRDPTVFSGIAIQ